jgi:hypothetical protein
MTHYLTLSSLTCTFGWSEYHTPAQDWEVTRNFHHSIRLDQWNLGRLTIQITVNPRSVVLDFLSQPFRDIWWIQIVVMHFLLHVHGLYLALCGIPILTLPIMLREGGEGLPLDHLRRIDLAQVIFSLSEGLPRLTLISLKLVVAGFLCELPDAALFF